MIMAHLLILLILVQNQFLAHPLILSILVQKRIQYTRTKVSKNCVLFPLLPSKKGAIFSDYPLMVIVSCLVNA